MKILHVGSIVYALLTANKELQNFVNNKINPLIADTETNYPFIVYKRNSVNVDNSKDGRLNERATVEVVGVTNNYTDSIKLAELICNSLIGKKGEIEGMFVKKIVMLDADEDYIEDAFVQRITFQIEII